MPPAAEHRASARAVAKSNGPAKQAGGRIGHSHPAEELPICGTWRDTTDTVYVVKVDEIIDGKVPAHGSWTVTIKRACGKEMTTKGSIRQREDGAVLLFGSNNLDTEKSTPAALSWSSLRKGRPFSWWRVGSPASSKEKASIEPLVASNRERRHFPTGTADKQEVVPSPAKSEKTEGVVHVARGSVTLKSENEHEECVSQEDRASHVSAHCTAVAESARGAPAIHVNSAVATACRSSAIGRADIPQQARRSRTSWADASAGCADDDPWQDTNSKGSAPKESQTRSDTRNGLIGACSFPHLQYCT